MRDALRYIVAGRARPTTRYAKSGDYSIAYQVVGNAPLDLVFVPGFISHVEHAWEDPAFAAFWSGWPHSLA